MTEKKQIKLSKKSIQFILAAIFIPLLLTFGLEHFGKFEASVLGLMDNPSATHGSPVDVRLNSRTFNTFFGNKIFKNLYAEKKRAYRMTKDFAFTTTPTYEERLPYYFEAVYLDIIYPLSLSAILIIIFLFTRIFSIKLVN